MNMTVKDLKAILDKLPEEMEIIETRCSDYQLMEIDRWEVVKGVSKDDMWIMRSHPTMSEENVKMEKEYLHFKGN